MMANRGSSRRTAQLATAMSRRRFCASSKRDRGARWTSMAMDEPKSTRGASSSSLTISSGRSFTGSGTERSRARTASSRSTSLHGMARTISSTRCCRANCSAAFRASLSDAESSSFAEPSGVERLKRLTSFRPRRTSMWAGTTLASSSASPTRMVARPFTAPLAMARRSQTPIAQRDTGSATKPRTAKVPVEMRDVLPPPSGKRSPLRRRGSRRSN